jgi:hypothetical protein
LICECFSGFIVEFLLTIVKKFDGVLSRKVFEAILLYKRKIKWD